MRGECFKKKKKCHSIADVLLLLAGRVEFLWSPLFGLPHDPDNGQFDAEWAKRGEKLIVQRL